METKIMTITPTMAREYLENSKSVNRSVSYKAVDRYARDMAAGKWTMNHQGIAFDDDGNIADGQHRLLACIQADVPFTTLVTTGVQIDGNIDIQRKRSFSDSVLITGLTDKGSALANNSIVGAIRYAMSYPSRSNTYTFNPGVESGDCKIPEERIHCGWNKDEEYRRKEILCEMKPSNTWKR